MIVLAEEINANAVLIDDLKARKVANLRGLKVIGTIAILLAAKDKGILRVIKPLMDELIKEKIRISKELYDHALELANEEVQYFYLFANRECTFFLKEDKPPLGLRYKGLFGLNLFLKGLTYQPSRPSKG